LQRGVGRRIRILLSDYCPIVPFPLFGDMAMRFDQKKWAYLRAGRIVALAAVLSASVSEVSAFAQAQPPAPAPQPSTAPAAAGASIGVQPAATPQDSGLSTIQVSSEDVVRMALENNLGIRAEQLNPQIETYGVAQARAVFAPSLVSQTVTRSSTTPPGNFLTGSGNTLTNDSFRTSAGLQQLLPWGGTRYDIGWDASKLTTSDASSRFNPQLDSGLSASITQPLLRNFTIDSARQTLLISQSRQQIADLQLRQTVTQTTRAVRNSYYDLINAIAGLQVAQQSLELSNTSLRNNERRVEVGTMAPIDIVQARAEVAALEESVIVAEGQIRSAEDRLRTLVMNPSQPDFWTTRLEPSDQPTLTAQPIDMDAAVRNALASRIDLARARKEIDQTDIGLRFYRNQKLPAVDLTANYDLVGTAGTQRQFALDPITGELFTTGQTQRNFSEALRDVFGNQFRTWSVQLNVSYPLGRSVADAAVAAGRLQREQQTTTLRDLETQVVASVRDAGRQVGTSLKRVESTRKARELAEQSLQAEEKRLAVGLSDTFRLLQAQRDLARQRVNELNAVISYNRALVDFEAVQTVPLR
jgi:outer membrane protein TolC